jgi:pimeloyl-ACP methyl ester carboxylesterase
VQPVPPWRQVVGTSAATPGTLGSATESFPLTTDDGVVLQAKLDVPVAEPPAGGWPLLVILEGAGAIDVDSTTVTAPNKPEDCKDAAPDGALPGGATALCTKADQILATRLAGLGFAVARMGKRGVTVDHDNPFVIHKDLNVMGSGTMSRRVRDTTALLAHFASDGRVDARTAYLWGVAEGTAVAALYASANPTRVAGMILAGPVIDSMKDLSLYANVGVKYDQLLAVADTNGDRRISKDEYEQANVYADPPGFAPGDPTFRDSLLTYQRLGRAVTFATFDGDGDGMIDRTDLESRLMSDLWLPELAAVDQGDSAKAAVLDTDDSLAQLHEAFAMPPLAGALLALDLPITIIVGDHDLVTPAAQLDWFVPRATAAGRTKLVTRIVDGHQYGKAHEDAGVGRIVELGWAKRE